jgi:hypothetical protein
MLNLVHVHPALFDILYLPYIHGFCFSLVVFDELVFRYLIIVRANVWYQI